MQDTAETGSMSLYTSRASAVQFWTFSIATFLAFITSSSLYFLPVILSSFGMNDAAVGSVVASSTLSIASAILVSGVLLQRFTALNIAILGQIISLLTFISLHWVVSDPTLAALSRFIGGIGFGLFWPAAMFHAKQQLSRAGMTYLIGIYGVMISAPTSIGPAITEWFFNAFGPDRLFLVLAAPLVIAILLLVALRVMFGAGTTKTLAKGSSYFSMFTNRPSFAPLLGLLIVGFIWGFGMSFVGPLVERRGLLVATFLSSATITSLVFRFTVMRYFSRQRREIILITGFILMAGSCFTLSFPNGNTIALLFSGILFGAGHSMLFPSLSVWSASTYAEADKAKAEAVIGVVLHLGLFGAPFIVGIVASIIGLNAWPMICTALALVMSATYLASMRAPRGFDKA